MKKEIVGRLTGINYSHGRAEAKILIDRYDALDLGMTQEITIGYKPPKEYGTNCNLEIVKVKKSFWMKLKGLVGKL